MMPENTYKNTHFQNPKKCHLRNTYFYAHFDNGTQNGAEFRLRAQLIPDARR